MVASQNGWVANERQWIDPGATAVGTAVALPGGVRHDAPGRLLLELAGRFHHEVEALVPGWCWGYAERTIRGSTDISNHASGTAIDVNAPRHPLGVEGTFSSTQTAAIRHLVGLTGGVVRWGGDYIGRKDEMHFEITTGATMAQCEGALAVLRSATPPPASDNDALLQRGDEGPAVRELQHVLNAWYPWLHLVEDGIYGPHTEDAVRELQTRAGITVDGIVGPVTRGVLGL